MNNVQSTFEQLVKQYEARLLTLEEFMRGQESGLGRNVIEKFIVKTGIADNVATGILSITTTNESGSTDGGGYACYVHALVAHGVSSTSSNAATKSFTGHFARAAKSDGVGVNSAVTEISETGSGATTSLTRDIGTVTMTVTETSEYQNDVTFQIDATGSGATTPALYMYVRLIWAGYLTAPTLTAL